MRTFLNGIVFLSLLSTITASNFGQENLDNEKLLPGKWKTEQILFNPKESKQSEEERKNRLESLKNEVSFEFEEAKKDPKPYIIRRGASEEKGEWYIEKETQLHTKAEETGARQVALIERLDEKNMVLKVLVQEKDTLIFYCSRQ